MTRRRPAIVVLVRPDAHPSAAREQVNGSGHPVPGDDLHPAGTRRLVQLQVRAPAGLRARLLRELASAHCRSTA